MARWQSQRILARFIDRNEFMLVGTIGSKHWSAIYTYRNGQVRIISVRRSRQGEINDYEEDDS